MDTMDLTGIKLGQYEIIQKIGQGGMAHVFKAYQPALNRYVAIKVLSPVLAEDPDFTERFQREAQSVARLHHPNILQVYDFGLQDKYNYIVMRYVEGSLTLGHLLREGTPTDKLIDYIIQVADALNYAHEQGIVHRDVKPSNILIDGKWALLSDFGLVKIGESSSHLTQTGMGIGTPAYMSPEQVSGVGVDHRSDIYALGVILHRVLTGVIPHDAPTPMALMVKRKMEPVTPPHQINPDIATSLEHVILRSLAPRPDDRYSTATEFAQALKKAETDPTYREVSLPTIYSTTDDPTIARTFKTPLPASRSSVATLPKKQRLWIGAAIAGVVVVIGVVIFLLITFTSSNNILANQPTLPTPTPEQATEPAVEVATNTPASPTDTPTPIPPSVPAAIAQTELEVHSGPGEAYDLLGYLPEGAKAEIAGRDKTGQWWQIKTSLSAAGFGWIKAGSDYVEATATDDVPIALAPPTATHTATPAPDTPTPTPTPLRDTPTPTPTPIAPTTAIATRAQISAPTPTKAPAAPTGQFVLLKPNSVDQPSFGMTEFEWQWNGQLGPDQGFEVRVWRDGEPPAGVHNAVEDNKNGNIAALSNNTYRLTVNIRDSFGVKGRTGDYLWTVVVVQISPEYKDLGIQAPPGRLRFEAGGGGGGKGGDGGGGGGTTF
jgi:serine/threonine protein kinase